VEGGGSESRARLRHCRRFPTVKNISKSQIQNLKLFSHQQGQLKAASLCICELTAACFSIVEMPPLSSLLTDYIDAVRSSFFFIMRNKLW
jgi:hypothetical protein